MLPSTLAGVYFRSVSRQWGVDRRPKEVCERGMVSYIRIIISYFLGPNNLWDIIKNDILRLYYGLPQPSPDVASTDTANPVPPSSVKRTTKLNIATWLVAHGTKLHIRSRLGCEVGRGWRGGLSWGAPGNSAAHVSTSWGEVGGHCLQV